ncbi:MAG: signal peptidase II [Patescibacteria group bacterium]
MAMFFVADRITKYFAINNLLPKINIGGFLKLSFTPNSFIAFSLPLSGTPLMIIISSVIIALVLFIIYLIINKKTETLEAILLTTILFGAISNYTDRINYGFVIDYIDIKNFTVFNLADVMIVLGAAVIILMNFFTKKHER